MNKTRKKFWLYLFIISILIGIFLAAFDVSKTMKYIIFVVFAVGVLVASMAIDMKWYSGFRNKIIELLPLINEEGKPDKFISEMETLFAGIKSPYLLGIKNINIAAAYLYKDNPKKALSFLEKVKVKSLDFHSKQIYYTNLSQAYFCLGENERAREIVDNNELIKYREEVKDSQPILMISILEIHYALTKGEYERALAMIEALEKLSNEYIKKDLIALKKKLYESRKDERV